MMLQPPNGKAIRFDEPVPCPIRVNGALDARWSDRLGGMAISTHVSGDGVPETTLTGRLPDQSALLGVLDTLYDWHCAPLSVQCLGTGAKMLDTDDPVD